MRRRSACELEVGSDGEYLHSSRISFGRPLNPIGTDLDVACEQGRHLRHRLPSGPGARRLDRRLEAYRSSGGQVGSVHAGQTVSRALARNRLGAVEAPERVAAKDVRPAQEAHLRGAHMGLTSVQQMLSATAPPKRRLAEVGVKSFAPPAPATILRHCRCQDCRRWDETAGQCEARGLVRYIPKADYHPAMQPFWSDLGMIRPEQWHYCADYHGPQISMDVWAWPKATPTAAQVGAGSNISSSRYREPNPDITADRGEPRVNGSFPGSYEEDRTGNSHAPVVCLLRVANTP